MPIETTKCPVCGHKDAVVRPDPKWGHRVLIFCQCYKKGRAAVARMDRKDLPQKAAPAPIPPKKKSDG